VTKKRDAIQCEELSVHGNLWSARHPSSYNSILHATFQLKEMTENVVGWGATR